MRRRKTFDGGYLPVSAIVTLALAVTICQPAASQAKYIDRTGKASFFSSAPLEDIDAHTDQVVSVLDINTGDIAASVLMRSFRFRKSLMQEHFNENYIESHKYPKASFRGRILNIAEIDLKQEGNYTLDIAGDITLHGVTKPLSVRSNAVVTGGRIQAKVAFPLTVKDFDIQIPRLVIQNIAEVVDVTVSLDYKPMEDL